MVAISECLLISLYLIWREARLLGPVGRGVRGAKDRQNRRRLVPEQVKKQLLCMRRDLLAIVGEQDFPHAIHQLARNHQGDARTCQKWASNSHSARKGCCPKLQSPWEGPCKMKEQLGEIVYQA
ncbi:hypothetical protein AOLI_G00181790 [Acnodon oligacanthus]